LSKLFPISDISNKQFPEARKLEDQGLHRIMFRWSPDDYHRVGEVCNGPHPEDGTALIVEDGIPTGFGPPDLDAEPQLTAPGVDAAFLTEAAARLFR
jgi:Mn-containing catalase